MEKNKYINPIIEVIKVNCNDIIVTSDSNNIYFGYDDEDSGTGVMPPQ